MTSVVFNPIGVIRSPFNSHETTPHQPTAYAGIPVTQRGVAVSFRVVTGHESPDKEESQIPWNDFKSDDTIVFLMGLHKLDKICEKLIEIGKPSDFPVAVISKGTTKEQKVVVGTLKDIARKAKGLPTTGRFFRHEF